MLDWVERGEIDLGEAYDRLRVLERSRGVRRRYARLAILVSVTGWVLFLNGVDAATVGVALLASVLTLPTGVVVDRLRLPSVTSTFLSAVILAAVPNLVAAAGVSLEVGPAVVGGLFVYLPGRALVSSVIDGLSNLPLSAVARGVQAIVAAGALAIGMLVGSRIGAGLGLNYRPELNAAPLAVSVLGAVVGMFGLAVVWAMPRALLLPTLVMGAAGWLVVALGTSSPGEGTGWAAYALGAALVGLCGVLFATLQAASASIYTGVAILPLVPGFTLYRGVLALAQGRNAAATATFGEAAVISLAIAVGVAFGLAFGRNLLAVGERIRGAGDRPIRRARRLPTAADRPPRRRTGIRPRRRGGSS
ncbi:MAG TPA: threonine/serine exporter family protein [Actinomycetes bacterium]|nr:threonine/serine exporter family protein [Actinomycetes bacterium]